MVRSRFRREAIGSRTRVGAEPCRSGLPHQTLSGAGRYPGGGGTMEDYSRLFHQRIALSSVGQNNVKNARPTRFPGAMAALVEQRLTVRDAGLHEARGQLRSLLPRLLALFGLGRFGRRCPL
jgi:hypothetical protein